MISDWTLWLEWFIKSVILIFALLGGFAYLTWYERRALARVEKQWPDVGGRDLYYGGTTYENRQGLGAHLSTGETREDTESVPQVQKESSSPPKEKELLAVPITKLYDRGTTLLISKLLHERIGEARVTLHPEAAKRLGVEEGQAVNVSFDGVSGVAVVKLDDGISEAVALVPRSMGIAIHEPVAVRVQVEGKVEA